MDNSIKRKKGAKKGRKALLVVILLFLTLFLLVFLYGSSKLNKISYDEPGLTISSENDLSQTAPKKAQSKVEIKEEIAKTAAAQSVVLPQGEAETESEIVNILLLGTDIRIPGTSDPGRADSTMNTLLPLIHTNLTKAEIGRLMLNAPKFVKGNVEQLQVPDENWTNGYIKCDFDYEHKKDHQFHLWDKIRYHEPLLILGIRFLPNRSRIPNI